MKPGQWLGAYAGRIIWDESVVKLLRLEPERLNARNLIDYAKCQLNPVMANDEILHSLHLREHELVSNFIGAPYSPNRTSTLDEIDSLSKRALERLEFLLLSRSGHPIPLEI